MHATWVLDSLLQVLRVQALKPQADEQNGDFWSHEEVGYQGLLLLRTKGLSAYVFVYIYGYGVCVISLLVWFLYVLYN